MKINKILLSIINEKKNNLNPSSNNFFDKNIIIPKPGEFIHVEYEHISTPLGKTKKVILTKHQFFGLCIGIVKRGFSTILKLRNVIKKKPVEFSLYIYSPLVFGVSKASYRKFFDTRAKIYFLKNKPLRFSKLRVEDMI